MSHFLSIFQLGTNDTGSVVLYGAGALVILWLSSAVIGAIDSIPLVCIKLQLFQYFHPKINFLNANRFWFIFAVQFPKLLEVVGLGYTVWFSTRYLLFKVLT